MNEHQTDEMIDLLRNNLSELREMRTNFNEFTGYNTSKMSEAVDMVTDRITGGRGGVGGNDLEDVKMAIDIVGSVIEAQ